MGRLLLSILLKGALYVDCVVAGSNRVRMGPGKRMGSRAGTQELKMKKLMLASILAFSTVFLAMSARPTHANPLILPAANFLINRMIAGVLASTLIARGFAENDQRISQTLSQIAAVLSGANRSENPRGALISAGGVPLWIGLLASLGESAVSKFLAANETEEISVNPTGSGEMVVKLDDHYERRIKGVKPPDVDEHGWVERTLIKKGIRVYRAPEDDTGIIDDIPVFPYGIERLRWLGRFVSNDPSSYVVLDFNQLHAFFETICARYAFFPPDKVEIYEGKDGRYWFECIFSESRAYPDGAHEIDRIARDLDEFPEKTSAGNQIDIFFDSKLDSSFQNLPLVDATIGNIVDAVWKAASSRPEYDGVLHDSARPISITDVGNWRKKNPGIQPVLSDLFVPASEHPRGIVPISIRTRFLTKKVPTTAARSTTYSNTSAFQKRL